MTNRILFGQKGGEHGLWVSRPGVNVLTAGDDDMLLSTSRNGLQIVASGVIYSPGNNTSHDFTIPNLGFTPLVLIGGSYGGGYSLPSPTTLRVHVYTYGGTERPAVVTWAVTNFPVLHG